MWVCKLLYLFSIRITLHPFRKADLPTFQTLRLHASPTGRSYFPPASPLPFYRLYRYRNFHLLSIDYAFQPRLRSRLTLRGRALLRNPWAFDGDDSHIPFRYSCQHSHLYIIHNCFRFLLQFIYNAPLPIEKLLCQLYVVKCFRNCIV